MAEIQCEKSQLHNHNVHMSSKADDAFASVGFVSWNKANERFVIHEKSHSHRTSVYQFSCLLRNENVLSKVNAQHDSDRKLATRCLVEIFTTLKFLARQGIAIRGHENKNSNFHQLLQLRTRDNKELAEWLQRKTTWTSVEIQNEMLELMAHSILRKFASEASERKYYSVLADETADCSRTEQMCISIRTVTDCLQAEEKVLGLYSVDCCDAASLTATIIDSLQRFNLDITQCRGQCYDGASVMSGHVSGTASRISKLEHRATYTHCQMHSLNLAIQDTLSHLPFLRDFLSLVKDLVVFLRDSPKRCSIVKKVASEVSCAQTHIRPLCPTRFSMNFHSFDGLKKQLAFIPDALDEVENSTGDFQIKATASGFQKRLKEFEFMFSLLVSHEVFEVTDNLSKQLQSPQVSAGEGVELCEFTVKALQALRSDDIYDSLWMDCKTAAEEMDMDPPYIPRQRKRNPKYDSGCAASEFANPKAYYRHLYFQVSVTKFTIDYVK